MSDHPKYPPMTVPEPVYQDPSWPLIKARQEKEAAEEEDNSDDGPDDGDGDGEDGMGHRAKKAAKKAAKKR